jgi:hypothetical protein
MSAIQPVFDTTISAVGTVGTETWVNVLAIPSGSQVWIGYATLGAVDKNLQFELRYNNSGQSTGTIANTVIMDFSGAQAGSSVDRDFYWYGALATMTVVSTGVEKLWLRVLGQGNTAAGFEYIIRYTIY